MAYGRRYPRVSLAFRAALAAALAWLCVQPIGGPANSYAYYAPLGAAIAVTSTVAGAVRTSMQAVAGVLIGAAMALVVQYVTDMEVLGLALVVGIGTLIAGWPRLGRLGSWVPIAAMFVLVAGHSDPERYVVGYLGLTSLGAAIGVALNLLFAPLPLSRSGRQIRNVRDALAGELDDLADGLRHEDPPTSEEWAERRRALLPLTREMSRMVDETAEARRANWRARRWVDTADRQYQLARALEQLTYLVEDVSTLLTHQEVAGAEHIALGAHLRPYAADLLAAMADLLEDLESPVTTEHYVRNVDDAMNRLVDGIRETRSDTGDDLFTAGTLVIAVRRAVAALVPAELAEEFPSRH